MKAIDIIFPFAVIVSLSHTVSSIRCLSCTAVAEPAFCTTIRNCPADNLCAVEQYRSVNGDMLYDVDCVAAKLCHANSSASQRSSWKSAHANCTDCCSTDMCNIQGCHSPDLPTDRGPMCYSCNKRTDPGKCQTIDRCGKDQQCAVFSEDFLGVPFYSSRCVPSFECRHVEVPIIGRREVQTLCSDCCHTDFCNDRCGDSSSSVTMSTETTTAASTHGTTSLPPMYSTGKEFIIMILPEYHTWEYVNIPQVYLIPSVPGVFTIDGPGVTGQSHSMMNLSEGMNTINITTSVITGENVIETKAVYINSSVDTSVFLMNFEQYVTDMSLVFPTKFCGTNYIIPSYRPTTNDPSVVGIASLESDTTVLIILNTPSGGITYDGHTYTDGDTLFMSLQRLQTFTLSHDHDLTGTRITSSKPVCAMAGTICSNVEGAGCSRLEEMIPPTEQFSTEFVIPSLYNRPGMLIRVMSYDKPSDLDITVGRSNESRTLSLYTYTDMDVTADEAVAVVSTSPILVTLYAKVSYNSDPFMIMVPGIDQYLSTYHFAVPDLGFTSHVSIVVPSDQVGGLRLNNRPLIPLGNTTVINNGIDFTVLYAAVATGSAVMNHVDGTNFGLFVYGRQQYDGFGYVAGMKFHTK